MRKVLFLFFAYLFIGIGLATAQNVTVSGVVMADEDDEPVVGASVLVKGTTLGTVTDINGRFQIQKVPSSAKTLQISYVGMKSQEVAIKPGQIKVVLKSDAETLDEVVVTGYGVQRKASFTGAASVIDNEVMEKKADANFVKSLEGSIAGLTMNNSSSAPGTWGSVNVRGMGSLSSSTQPLYVIDGMPVNSDYDSMSSSSYNFLDPMASINPNDIETVTVLKDASATAIYGARASNGVIVITTKKGGQSKLNINLDIKQGVSSVAHNNMEYANADETIDLFARGLVASGNYKDYDSAMAYLKKRYSYWDGSYSTDWFDLVTRSGYYQDYNLNIQGSTGDTHYYISGEYLDTDGIVIGSDMKRYSGRMNLDTKYKFLSAGMNSSVSYTNKNSFSQSTGGSMSSPLVTAQTSCLPFFKPYNEDGTYNLTQMTYNPLASKDEDLGDLSEVSNLTVNLNPYLRVDFGKGFWAKTNLGVNIMDQRQYDYWSAVYNNQGKSYNGLGQQYNSRFTTITWTNTFGWNKTINEKHNIAIMLGQEAQSVKYWYEYYEKSDFPFATAGMRDMTTAGNSIESEYYKKERKLASYFADAHYDYEGKYYLSASYRRDGSSLFGSNKRWGNFWSVGAKWRLSEEAFLKDNKVITNAALRVSEGTVGNQDLPSWYAARGYYKTGYNYDNAAGMVPYQISNPDLTWETSNKFDLGFDLSFINRIHLTFDFYNELTSDALYEVPLSQTTGIESAYMNIGKVRNRGIEVGINANIINNKDFTLGASATLTWNKNRVVKLATDEPIESTYTVLQEGHPYRQFYMREYAGVDRETGKALYYLNETGDETTTNWSEAAKRYVGSAEPKVYGGFAINSTFHGFDLALNFNYRLGGKVFDSGSRFTGRGTSLRTPLKYVVYDSWTEDNKDAKYPQWIYGGNNGFNSSSYYSTFDLMSGNYLRLSNIAFGYTLPTNLTKKAFLQKVRFYTTFDNVFTITASDFRGYTPDTFASGVIAWQYPAMFTFTGGVQITF
jgi:TonB-linked SusC/RagA family outer membrane protein